MDASCPEWGGRSQLSSSWSPEFSWKGVLQWLVGCYAAAHAQGAKGAKLPTFVGFKSFWSLKKKKKKTAFKCQPCVEVKRSLLCTRQRVFRHRVWPLCFLVAVVCIVESPWAPPRQDACPQFVSAKKKKKKKNTQTLYIQETHCVALAHTSTQIHSLFLQQLVQWLNPPPAPPLPWVKGDTAAMR